MSELERSLTQLGREVSWPPTPELAGAVRARLEAEPARRSFGFPLRRTLALALIALLLMAGAVVAAVPSARDAVLELFGLQGATVERREQLPPAPATGGLDLGERTTLADARADLDFTPVLPAEPDAVYVRSEVPGGELVATYAARAGLPRAGTTGLGLVLSEFRGDLAPEYLQKIAGQATAVERLRVDGHRALWLSGAPHFFLYRQPDGDLGDAQMRLAQNVLLVERGPLLVRMEGAFGRERALGLARSLRER